MNVSDLLPFLLEVDRLKEIKRQSLIHSGGRRENSAEHSWHLAIAVMIFHKLAPADLDLNLAIKMALLHDIVEIDAGDMFVYGDLSEKEQKELAALDRLMALLPKDLSHDLKSIWLEFEAGTSTEAKYVSALDRFLPMYSNYLNDGHSWRQHGITANQVIDKNGPSIKAGLPVLWENAKAMIEASVSCGSLLP